MILNIRDASFRENPYPTFARLREFSPVTRLEPHGHWAIARHFDVISILKNPKLFPSSGLAEKAVDGPEFLLQTRGIIDCDPPEHTRLRMLVSKAFLPSAVRAMEPRIRELSRSLIREWTTSENGDFVELVATPLPIIVIAEMLGIDPARRDEFKRWSDTLITWRNTEFIEDAEKRRARELQITVDIETMYGYLTDLIAQRGRSPKADLISLLIQACEGEQKLTSREVLGFVRLLLVAGNETTTNLLGNTLLALLNHPTEWDRVKRKQEWVPNLIEESLRYDSPAVSLTRRVADDTEIAGVRLAKGDFVLPLLGSANHDETIFNRPSAFDITRPAPAHLSFGSGIHFCLGATLARLQARIVFEEVFALVDSIERPDSLPLERIDSFFFRGLKRLPVIGRQLPSSAARCK